MNSLKKYANEKNLTAQDIATELKEKLGRPISATGVEMMMNRQEAPIPWLTALGLNGAKPKEPSGLKDEKTKKSSEDVKSPGAAVDIHLPFEPVSARATIELIYTMAGKGAAMASKTPPVGDAWHNAAPQLAEGWIEWAKENRTVANGIALLTVGGPGGQVILMNASLLITTLMLIQQHRNIDIIPPGFNIYEGMSDEDIQAQTEQAVDGSIGGA